MTNGICAGRGRRHDPALQNGADANGPSLLVSLQPDCDSDNGADDDDVQIIEPPPPSQATAADGRPVIVFKVTHKAPSGMRRPLAAVDNIRHGDIAIQTYQALRHRDQIQLHRLINHDVRVMRILGSSHASGVVNLDSMVMQKMLVWDTVGSVPIDSGAVGLQNEHAVNMVEDMVQARAFLGSGRPFEFCGSPKEQEALTSLRDRGLIVKATADRRKKSAALLDMDDEDSNSWYLTQKAASLLEVGVLHVFLLSVFNVFNFSPACHYLKLLHSVGLCHLACLAGSAHHWRFKAGVFPSCRHSIGGQNHTGITQGLDL